MYSLWIVNKSNNCRRLPSVIRRRSIFIRYLHNKPSKCTISRYFSTKHDPLTIKHQIDTTKQSISDESIPDITDQLETTHKVSVIPGVGMINPKQISETVEETPYSEGAQKKELISMTDQSEEIDNIMPVMEIKSVTTNQVEPSAKQDTQQDSEQETFWSKWSAYVKQLLQPSISWLLHFGNGLAICSMVMQEMLPLRICMVGANACALIYYRTQGLKVPAYWSSVFLVGHSIMIIRLLLENRSVAMSDIEHTVYCNAFREHGFTPHQFKQIMKLSKYMRVSQGDIICYRGKPKHKTMYVLGSVELQQNGTSVGGLIDGFVGDLVPDFVTNQPEDEQSINAVVEIMDVEKQAEALPKQGEITKMEIVSDVVHLSDVAPVTEQTETEDIVPITINVEDVEQDDINDADIWHHTVVALETCTIFVWDREELHKLIRSNPRLNAAAVRAMSGDLKSKLKTDKKFNSIKTYRGMLEIVIYDKSINAEEKIRLDKFREEQHITQKEHEAVIISLGWTMEEYDRGLMHTESSVEKIRHWYLLNLTKKYKTD
eukprot:295227_1